MVCVFARKTSEPLASLVKQIDEKIGEDGKLIFEMPEKPAGGLTKVIKKAAKVHAKIDIKLKVRGGGAELDDETDLDELTDFGTEPELERYGWESRVPLEQVVSYDIYCGERGCGDAEATKA